MLRFLTAGESHGRGLVALVESFPAGFPIDVTDIDRHLSRRQRGHGRGKRMQIERDRVVILAGLRHGQTLGSPIACLIENREWARWKAVMAPSALDSQGTSGPARRAAAVTAARPGHADLAGAIKFDTHDLRDVLERASARETAARVACGAIARQLLEFFDIRIASHVLSIGRIRLNRRVVSFGEVITSADDSPVRCVDPTVSKEMIAEINEATREGDTVGGVFEVRAVNLPVGLGSPAQWSTRLDGALAAAIMSIPSVKAVEIGDGVAAGRKRGSQVHDRIEYSPLPEYRRTRGFFRRTNRAGGIEGGMTNGAELVIRGTCKPIATLTRPLDSIDVVSKKKVLAAVERSDVCIVPAAAVVGEAMAAMVLASAFTDTFGGDNRSEIETNFQSYLDKEY
jgi:chorismate synthase